jgi:hypothetical protein
LETYFPEFSPASDMFWPFLALNPDRKLLQKANLIHKMALLNIIPLTIVPCAGAHFRPEISYYIFCPSSAKQTPVCLRMIDYQHKINDMHVRQLPKNIPKSSSCHEKNNGYLDIGKFSIVPQSWEEVRPHFDIYAPAWADS